jgi:hypothetical protein
VEKREGRRSSDESARPGGADRKGSLH